MCKCGLNHRGYELNLCRIELAKRAATQVPAPIKQTILSDPGGPKQRKTSVTVTPKPVTVTNRMTELRKRKAAAGMIQVALWMHPDDMAAIKKYAKELDGNRSKVS